MNKKDKFCTLNQYVETEERNWQSKHPIQDVWLSKSSEDTDELSPNAVATKRDSPISSSGHKYLNKIMILKNVDYATIKFFSFADPRDLLNAISNAQQEKICLQNNLHNKENTSINGGM